MGNFLEKTPSPQSPPDQSLLAQLKRRNLQELTECITVLQEDYADCLCLDYSQFEDIFCPIVDDPEPFFLEFQNDHNIDGTVDIYEILAAFAIFAGEKFKNKMLFIFQLFDFDQNKNLDVSELVLTLQSAARGLFKLLHIDPPSLKSIEQTAKEIFILIDDDHNEKVSFEEFTIWVKGNKKLQEFLLKYTGTQSYEYMKNKFDMKYFALKSYFSLARESAMPTYAKKDTLRKIFQEQAHDVQVAEADLNLLFEILENSTAALSVGTVVSGENYISKEAYESVMKAWCAFSAADINGDNQLMLRELHSLIWLYEGQEPSEARIKNELYDIDKTHDGYIQREEWMRSLCSSDKNGKLVFRANLRTLFEKYDADNSGHLNIDELKELVSDAFREYIKRAKDVEQRKALHAMIRTLTEEILKGLDGDKEGSVTWNEFKNYMEVAIDKFEKLRDFLKMNM